MDIRDEYLEWLYGIVCDDTYSNHLSYKKLFRQLDSINFTWKIFRDENRAIDGLILRDKFLQSTFRTSSDINHSCSVLEALIALAIRCEDSIAADESIGDRTGQWFWEMIVNLGLGGFDDLNYDCSKVDEIIDIFLSRTYSDNGVGCAFRVNSPKAPMNETELWYQMNWHLADIL